jgi:hypothetical protein
MQENIKQLFNDSIKGPWVSSDKNDVQFKVLREGRVLYIYFQGTVTKRDWIQNFKFWIKKYNNEYIHSGFLENYLIVKKNIHYIIEHLGYEIDKIIISGYSQGAALSVLCYEDLMKTYFNVYCYTFGSPRIYWLANKTFKNRFNNVFNYQIFGDIITKLPLWIFGFRHVGNIVKLGKRKIIALPKYHYIDYYNKCL